MAEGPGPEHGGGFRIVLLKLLAVKDLFFKFPIKIFVKYSRNKILEN